VADNSASFAIELEDETSGAAETAATSLQKLQEKLLEDTAALRGMQNAMRQLQGGSAVSVEAFRQLKDQITAQKASIASSQEQYVKLGGNFKAIKKPADEAGAGVEDFARTLKGAAGGMGGFIERGVNMIKGLGTLGIAGAAIIATVAIAALTIAIVAVIAKLAEFALGAADAARSQGLLLEAASAIGDHPVESYDALAEAVERVGKNVPIAQAKVADFAGQLLKAGIAGKDLERALGAVSISESVGADTTALIAQFKAAKDSAKAIDAIAGKVEGKFGGVVRAQMLGLNVQTTKFKENLAGLFKNVRIEPFLEALSKLLSIFDADTIAGKALQVLAESLLNPIFGMMTKLEPLATNFFKGLIIGALLFTIAVLKVRNAISDAFGGDILGGIDLAKVGMYAGVAAAGVLIVVLGTLLAVLSALAISAATFMLPAIIAMALVGAAIYGAIYVIGLLIGWFKTAYDYISNLDFAELGYSIVSGLIGGLLKGEQWLIDSVKGLATKAKDTLVSALGIGSPSKVFASLGTFTAQGFAEGIEAGAAPVDSAVGAMVNTEPPSGAATTSTTSSSSKSTGPITIIIQAGSGAKEIADEVKRVLGDLIEGVAIQMGAPLEGGTT
jgi:hypothetical protein